MAKVQEQGTVDFLAAFPIFTMQDFDLVLGNGLGWPVATRSYVPEEFVKRLTAAAISYQLANNSIDHVYKTYLKDFSYSVQDRGRLDCRAFDFVSEQANKFSNLLFEVTSVEPKNLGEMVGEWTLLRFPFTIQLMLMCANRGALFETISIARTVLEQLAWALAVELDDDADEIKGRSASKSIPKLKPLYSTAGSFYGWLSSHAHWNYAGHNKVWKTGDDGRLSHLFASPLLKLQSLLVVLLVSDVAHRLLRKLCAQKLQPSRADEVSELYSKKYDEMLNDLLDSLKEYLADDADCRLLMSFFKLFPK